MGRAASYLAAAIVFVAVFLLIEQTSPFFQSCVGQESSDASNHAGKESYSGVGSVVTVYIRCSGRFIDGHGAGITAFFTIILAVSTILLWGVTNKAAEAAKVAAEYIPTVEGAHVYVVIKKDEIFEQVQLIGKGAVPPNFTPQIRVALKNFGKTPAFIESFNARLSYVSTKKPVSGFEARIQPNTIIAADDETEPPLVVSAPELSKTDADTIWRAAAHLILEGTFVYRDILGGKWIVRFDGRTDNDNGRFRLDNYPRKNTKSSASLSQPT
jgi:hypothetical protein